MIDFDAPHTRYCPAEELAGKGDFFLFVEKEMRYIYVHDSDHSAYDNLVHFYFEVGLAEDITVKCKPSQKVYVYEI